MTRNGNATTSSASGSHSTAWLISISLGTRLLVDTAKQMFGPFLAIFAAGMGMDIVALGRLLGARNAVGFTAPIFGALADRFGYRRILQAELVISGTGMILIGASRSPWALTLGMLTVGVGTAAFVPSLQAYLSTRLPYDRRARGLGIVEYAWALSNLVGLSAMGFLIQRTSWRAPFFILGAGIVISAWLFQGAPPVAPADPPPQAHGGSLSLGAKGRLVAFRTNGASAWATIAVMGLLVLAGMNVSIVYGAWLQGEYGLDAVALGATALVVGAADLAASVLVSVAADRLGKRRSVLGGLALSLVAYALLPVLNRGLVPALAGIALMRFAFEFSIVSLIPLLSEQAPEERGKALALGAVVGLAGASVASVSGPWALMRLGVAGLAAVSLAATVGCIAVVRVWVRE
ncbi:MAG: MFS transporter [Chloroflexi bacterium]|nr:MFS transporter [Chloroflexota bacterium]